MAEAAGLNPVQDAFESHGSDQCRCGATVAQLPCKQFVGGSIPLTGSIIDLICNQIDLEPEVVAMVDKHFWELI